MATLTSFSDEFDGEALDEEVWSIGTFGGDLSVSGGTLTLGGGTNGGDITTIEGFDVTIGGFEILITSFADVNSAMYIRIQDDLDGELGFLLNDFLGQISFYIDDDDEVYEEGTVAYDGGTWSEGYFRFRVTDSNDIYWETSSDGTNWTQRFTYNDTDSLFNYSNVFVNLNAVGTAGSGNAYDVEYVRGIDSAGEYFVNGILSLPSAGSMFPITST